MYDRLYRVLYVLSVLLLIQLASAAQTPTAEELLDKWARAIGGRERIARVKATHQRAVLEMNSMKGVAESWITVDGKERDELTMGNFRQVTVFDGSRGWIRDSKGDVRELSATEVNERLAGAYMNSFSQFFPNRRAGKVEFAGEEDGAYILRLVPEGGQPVLVFLDKTTGLPVKQQRSMGDRTFTFFFTGWLDVDGMKVPSGGRYSNGEPSGDFAIRVETVEVNPELTTGLFTQPSGSGL